MAFINDGAYIYSAGTFTGSIVNDAGGTININSAAIPFSAGVVNNGRMTVTNGSGAYSGPISGTTGTLIFNGTTAVTLSGTNTYSGSTVISAGTVILGGPMGTAMNFTTPTAAFGSNFSSNITISANGTLQTTTDLQFASTDTVTVNGGIFSLNTRDESIGTLNMTAGQVSQNSGSGLGVTTGHINIANGASIISGGLRSVGPYNFNVSSVGSLTVSGNIGGYAGYNNGSAAMVLTGGGTMTIWGSSPLTTIDIKQGILQFSQGGTLSGANTSVTVESAGALSLGSQSLTIGDLFGSGTVGLGTGTLTVTSSGSGPFTGTINGTGTLTKIGAGTFTLTGNDAGTGTTNVNFGAMTLPAGASISSSIINVAALATLNLTGTVNNIPNLNITGAVNFGVNPGTGVLVRNIGALTVGSAAVAGNGLVTIAVASPRANRTLLQAASVTLSGVSNAWTSKVDLANNDLIVHNGSLTNLTNQVKGGFANGLWTGSGITSSSAAANTTHLTAVGVILNDDGTGNPLYASGSPLGLFDGMAPSVTDVLVKYTYYGDANLDGKVDASDYSRIDSAFLNPSVGHQLVQRRFQLRWRDQWVRLHADRQCIQHTGRIPGEHSGG